MAAKKKASAPRPPSPKPGAVKKRVAPADAAYNAILKRYGNQVSGGKTMKEAIQSFQDVVAESSLVDKFSSRTLDAAAARIARDMYQGEKRATKYAGKRKM